MNPKLHCCSTAGLTSLHSKSRLGFLYFFRLLFFRSSFSLLKSLYDSLLSSLFLLLVMCADAWRRRRAAQVVACPGGVATGHTYFIPSEEHLESGITTRGFMEARMVVALAGRQVPPPPPGCAGGSTPHGALLSVHRRWSSRRSRSAKLQILMAFAGRGSSARNGDGGECVMGLGRRCGSS